MTDTPNIHSHTTIPAKLLSSKSNSRNPVNNPILDGIDPIHYAPDIIKFTAMHYTSIHMPQNNLSLTFKQIKIYTLEKICRMEKTQNTIAPKAISRSMENFIHIK